MITSPHARDSEKLRVWIYHGMGVLYHAISTHMDLGTRQTIASLPEWTAFTDSRALELMHVHSHVYVYLLWRSTVKAFHLLCASLCEWCQVISIVCECGFHCRYST